MKTNIVNLEISSFDGISPGATHYYGKLICNGDRIELERKLNSRTLKDFGKESYHIGDVTTRFNSEEHLIRAARKIWKRLFPKAKVLLVGSSAIYDPQKCLDGEPELKKKINEYYRRSEKVGGYEGNEKEMTKISNEYMKEILKYS